jgi:integrase
MKNPRNRFRVVEYTNKRTGSKSWRVTGIKRDGSRVRENHVEARDAQLRQVELEGEFLARQTDTTLRATRLTDTQIHISELALAKLSDDADLLRAVDYWLKHGKQHAVAESVKVDEAVKKFTQWLDGEGDGTGNGRCTLRELSRSGLRRRVEIFRDSIGNLNVNDVTPDIVENFLEKLRSRQVNPISAITCDNYRRDISRFFSWCIERPRRWTVTNPCKEIRVAREEKAPPAILTVEQCEALLREASKKRLAPYVAVCLFGGLRPFETSRLTWEAVNLDDREIRLEGNQTKTGRPRVVAICETLHAWLKAYKGQQFFPSGWHKQFRAVKAAAKITEWPVDVMRHTAISHYFRKTGSYGQTAEQFGNSEAIIKNHYQGRVSSEDTKEFYALRPRGKKTSK